MARAGSSRVRRARARPQEVEEEVERAVEDRGRTTEVFRALPHKEPLWIDFEFLNASGFRDRLTALLDQCGWSGLLTLRHTANVDDTSEFLASFQYMQCNDGFSYRFRGEEYECTLLRLRRIFGWADPDPEENLFYRFTSPQELNETYHILSGGRYMRPSEASVKTFVDPFWYYVHFIMSRTILARGNGNDKPSIRDFTLLGHLIRGVVPNWGHLFCRHLRTIRTRGPVCVGGMVTYFLSRMHPDDDPLPGQRILQCAYADFARFLSGRTIILSSRGEVRWIYFAVPALRPELSPPRARGRPAGQGRGRRRDRERLAREMEPLQVLPPADGQHPPPQPQQGGLPQDQVAYMYNLTRSMMFGLQGGFQPVPPPPGWQPGDAIPSEHRPPPSH